MTGSFLSARRKPAAWTARQSATAPPAGCRAAGAAGKAGCPPEQRRGRMTSLPERLRLIRLIGEAVRCGAGRHRACRLAGISLRTLQRWRQCGTCGEDRRPSARRPAPANRLTFHPPASPLRGNIQAGRLKTRALLMKAVRGLTHRKLSGNIRAEPSGVIIPPAQKIRLKGLWRGV